MANPRAMHDPNESFTGAEFDPATDLKEAQGDINDPGNDSAAAAEVNVAATDVDAGAAAGEALIASLERDVLSMGQGADWNPIPPEEFAEQNPMAEAVSDILNSDWDPQDKESALEDVMAEQGRGVVEATQHLTGMLTGTDTSQSSHQDKHDPDQDAASAVASEVGRVSQTSEDTAAMIVGALRTNVGISAVGQGLASFSR